MPAAASPGAIAVCAVLLFALVAPAAAQVADAGSPREGMTALNGPWRVHFGDDPRWAAPNFDDSGWPLRPVQSDNSLGKDHPEYAWMRLRVQLPAGEGRLALAVTHFGEADEVFVDGRLIGSNGIMEPRPQQTTLETANRDTPAIFVLPARAGDSVEIAIRAWCAKINRDQSPAATSRAPILGTPGALEQLRQNIQRGHSLEGVPGYVLEAVAASIGLFALALFLLRRRAGEYAWAAVFLLVPLAREAYRAFHWNHAINPGLSDAIEMLLEAIGDIGFLMFVWKFTQARSRWIFQIAIVLALLVPACPAAGNFGLPIPVAFFLGVVLRVALVGILLALLLAVSLRGNRDARLLLPPFAMYGGLQAYGWLGTSLQLAGVDTAINTPVAYRGADFTVTWLAVGELLSYLAVGAVLVLRFTRAQRQEERLSVEMASAREVQQRLVPDHLPALRGLRVDHAYLPASEVGGDFYQVIPGADGANLIVLGDVSGKGLQAAMKGALAIGALRAFAALRQSPGELLGLLNRQLAASGDGSFLTCICARIDPCGKITIANAGHLAPYLNGLELPSEPSLPVGIDSDVEYSESFATIQEGDTLTFLSDGVVEARNAQGELFGFDRARALSRRAAAEIAAAAREFGQEDDISVLSLTLVSG